jgi:hypothetical protein
MRSMKGTTSGDASNQRKRTAAKHRAQKTRAASLALTHSLTLSSLPGGDHGEDGEERKKLG